LGTAEEVKAEAEAEAAAEAAAEAGGGLQQAQAATGAGGAAAEAGAGGEVAAQAEERADPITVSILLGVLRLWPRRGAAAKRLLLLDELHEVGR
jgi:hypothetical protein